MSEPNFSYITKKASKTFYYASLLFPKSIQSDVFKLYAFLRAGDNMVDHKPPKRKEFFAFKNETIRTLRLNRNSQNPLINAFFKLYKGYGFKRKWVVAYFESMESDLSIKEHTKKSLDTFIYGSAEVVGMMMASVMQSSVQGLRPARLLGKGMQLVNIIRDIYEDRKLGRIYIPKEHLKQYGLSSVSLFSNANNKQKNALIRFEANEAIKILSKAKLGFHHIPLSCRSAIHTAFSLYAWTARKMVQNPEAIQVKKIKPPLPVILWYAFKYAYLSK